LGEVGTAELVVRVAAQDGRLTVQEAETLYSSLRDVPGFAKTAKWLLVGERGSKQLIGSLQELQIASKLQKSGYKVVELRAHFRGDPAKKFTDIDLIVEKGGKRFAIESKAWGKEAQWDQIALDAGTLKAYEKIHPGTTSYFLFKQSPSDLVIKKLNESGIRHVIVTNVEALKFLEL
jgi:Holliday junction resolvase-like predicted endonuclease